MDYPRVQLELEKETPMGHLNNKIMEMVNNFHPYKEMIEGRIGEIQILNRCHHSPQIWII